MTARSGLRLVLAAAIVAIVAILGYGVWAPGVQASEPAGARPIPSVSIPVVTITLGNPVFTVTPTTLEFGSVAIGSSRQLTVTILNTSVDNLADLSVEGGTPTLSMFGLAQGAGCTGTILAGHTCTLVYTFTPVSTGTVTSTSTFRASSNHVPPQQHTITMTGCGLGQGVSCTPAPTTAATSPRTPGQGPGQSQAPPAAPGVLTVSAAAEPGAGVVPIGAPSGQAVVPFAASSGPSAVLVLLLVLVAALLGAVAAGLVMWRGRWLWSKLVSRGGSPGG